MMPGMIVLPLTSILRRAGGNRHRRRRADRGDAIALDEDRGVLDHAGRALNRTGGDRFAIVITRAPTSATVPDGMSLFTVKPIGTPFASGSAAFA